MDKLERARQLGILKDGWRFLDYCLETGPKFGWLCNIIWGEKGSGKSATMLQHGYAAFHGFDDKVEIAEGIQRGIITDWTNEKHWQDVLDHVVFRPKDFAAMLKVVLKDKNRLSWVGWDDINIHFPRSMYSTNRRVWEQFSKNWEGFRANLSVFECTAPRKDKVVSFILSDMTWDSLVSARHLVEVTRWFWDRDFYEPEKVLKFRIDVETESMEIGRIPSSVWHEYWSRKIQLIDESTQGFEQMLEDIDKPTEAKKLKEYLCPICGRDLGNSYNYKMHIGVHKRKGEEIVTPP